MSMFCNSLDFWIILKLLFKCLSIIRCIGFSLINSSYLLTGIDLPNSDVHIIRSTIHKLSISWEWNWVHLLHSLSVIHFPWISFIEWENPNSSVKWSRNEFPPTWTKCNWHDSRNVIFMDHSRLFNLPDIISITIWIIISNHNI